jgi:hypothetical protein
VRRGKRFGLGLFATAVAFYALAYFAPLSAGDAAVFLLLVALTGQRIRPFLLVLASSVRTLREYRTSGPICFSRARIALVGEYMVHCVYTSPRIRIPSWAARAVCGHRGRLCNRDVGCRFT